MRVVVRQGFYCILIFRFSILLYVRKFILSASNSFESGFVAFNILYMQFLNVMDLIIPFVTHLVLLCLK